MIITRHLGKRKVDIVLTSDECLKVFYEMRDIFDKQDIEDNFESLNEDECMESYGITLEEAKGLYGDMAQRMRHYIDNDDSWTYARDEAIRDIINKYREERK